MFFALVFAVALFSDEDDINELNNADFGNKTSSISATEIESISQAESTTKPAMGYKERIQQAVKNKNFEELISLSKMYNVSTDYILDLTDKPDREN